MFPNRRYVPQNREQRDFYSEHTICNGARHNRFSDPNQTERGMEIKLLMGIFTGLGITSYVWAIILNIGSWKSNLLFGLALLFGIAKFLRYAIRTWQDYRKGELEIKKIRKEQGEN